MAAEAAVTVLYLVRHAAHGLLGRVLAGRMPGVPLSPLGVDQAARLAERFAALGVVAVLSSPVQRARETAGPIAAACGVDVTIEPGLDEIDFGAWTGLRFDALDGVPEWDLWNSARATASCPDGETMAGAQVRAVAACQRAAERWDGAVVVVSHQDVLKAVLAFVLGLSLDRLNSFALDPASCSAVTFFDGGARVEGINQAPVGLPFST